MQTLKFEFVKLILRVDNGIDWVFIFLLDSSDVLLELFSLLLLKCLKYLRSLEQLSELTSEGTLFNWVTTLIFIRLRWIKDEVDNTAISTLNKSGLLTARLLSDH